MTRIQGLYLGYWLQNWLRIWPFFWTEKTLGS